jgi:tripartite-type tricarboxylate transporter receptor subunit TctC
MKTAACALVAASIWSSAPARAPEADYPSRQIDIVVPFAPGGAADLSIRYLADKWKACLGQPVVIVNKPGAGSAVGAKYVSRAKPDGYTLLVASETSLVTVPILQPNAGYQYTDFTYLFTYSKGAIVFAARSDAPWKTLGEFLDAAKKSPKPLSYASYGTGTIGQIAMSMLLQATHTPLNHVPFKSSPEAGAALLGRHVEIAVPSLIGPLAKNKDIRLLATSSSERVAFAPDVPTLKELGFNTSLNYYNVLVGPKGLPKNVTNKILGCHQQVYEKEKADINAAMVRLELVPVTIDGPSTMKVMGERSVLFKKMLRVN